MDRSRRDASIERPIRIGLQIDSIDPYWVEVNETVWRICRPSSLHSNLFPADVEFRRQQAADRPIELIEMELNVEFSHPDEAATKVEEIMALELDVLIAVPYGLAVIQGVLERGLPVIALIDRDIEHPLFSSPPELSLSAEMACNYLVERLGGQGNVLIAGGRLHADREKSSSRVLAALDIFGRAKGVRCVHAQTPWDYAGTLDALRGALADHDQPFDGLFGLSDTLALAAYEVCTEYGLLQPGATVVGINGDPLAITSISQGGMSATVATSAADIAEKAVALAFQVARGEALPPRFFYQPVLIDRENVAEFALTKLAAIADMPSRLVGVNRNQEAQRLVELETSLAINRRMGSIIDRDAFSYEIAELIRTNYGYDDVQIFLWCEDGQALILDRPGVENGNPVRVALADSSVLGHALLRNRVAFVPDTRHSQRFAPDPYWPETRSRVVAPIRLGVKTLGVLDLHSRQLRRHTRIELDALQSLADQLGVAMRNTELYADALAARAEAEKANHLKTRLLANISHQLRTPLNVVLGYSQAALSEPNPYGTALPKELIHDLGYIRNSGEHLVRLINDLLDMSLADIGALDIFPESFEPLTLLQETFHGMAGSFGENQYAGQVVEWRMQLPKKLPLIDADPVRVRQIVLNLLSNASKFTESGHITLGAAAEGAYLHIWVEDTGSGITEKMQEHIFEAFSASEQSGGDAERVQAGIGLGLSVTNRLVKLHGGKIEIDSSDEQGTVCHVYLPLVQIEEESEDGDNSTRSPVSAMKSETIFNDPILNGALQHAGELVQRTALYIQENQTVSITRQEIADSVGASPAYVSRLFRQEIGMSPGQYLNRLRIAEAQKLLLSSNDSVTEIAGKVGYNDAAYFSRIFRREIGQPPLAYRKTYRQRRSSSPSSSPS